MTVERVAMLSVHTSPLAQPGTGDGGGMNVYVRSLGSALARAGVACDVFTRFDHPALSAVVEVEPGFRVVHIDAGPRVPIPKRALPGLVDEFAVAARQHMGDAGDRYDALHANYWISGAVGHKLKHDLDLPLVATFHTLARVKAEAGVDDDPAERTRVEGEVVRCADLMVAATDDERLTLVAEYGAEPDRVEVIPPGVDHSIFFPADAAAARGRLSLPADRPVLLYVGRIQPLKGADLAVRALASLTDPQAELVVVGGPSGPEGATEVTRLHELADELGVAGRVRWVDPQPHAALADYYRAADVCLVPSRSESFGLVALEAAACGTPVVASNVGGLRSLVDHGHTGFLVDGRDAADYAAHVERLLTHRSFAEEVGVSAAARSGRYTWSITAARLRRLYADLSARTLVQCT
jgi:D-inositol-3-phosphate glycosyltransferase